VTPGALGPSRQRQNTLLNSPSHTHHSAIPPSCPSSHINLVLHPSRCIPSSPPNHFILYSLRTEDIHYLKWNRMNIKWVHQAHCIVFPPHPTPSLSLSLSLYHLWLLRLHRGSTMYKVVRAPSAMQMMPASFTLMRAPGGLAVGAEQEIYLSLSRRAPGGISSTGTAAQAAHKRAFFKGSHYWEMFQRVI